MNSLLAIEWLKIKRYRTFWILMGLFAVLLPLLNYEIASGIIKIGGGKGTNFLGPAYSFPGVWGNLGFWASIFVTFLSILVIILTCNEYTFRTNRQNIIDGWKRTSFFHAKILLIVVLSIVVTLYLFILGALFGYFNSGSFSDLFDDAIKIFYFFILSLNYMGFALFIAIWIKRSGLAISLFLLYDLIIENIVKGIVNWKFDTQVGNFLPLQTSDELLPLPSWKMMQAMMGNTDSFSSTTYLIITIVWCLIYYFAGRRILLRRDW